MKSRLMPKGLRPFVHILVSLLLFASAGCSWLEQYRGEGFPGEDATWGAGLRPGGDESEGSDYFFDKKARQIERSLGY